MLISVTANLQLFPQQAVYLLQQLHPSSPCPVVALSPDGGIVAHDVFGNGCEDKLAAWITSHPSCNLHYHPATVSKADRGKARNEEIWGTHWLWSDIDLKDTSPGLDWRDGTAVQAAYDTTLVRINAFALPPTIGIWTGGGFHLLWKLAKPIGGGRDHKADTDLIKEYLTGIAVALGGDRGVTAPSSMLRLPGTINWPNHKKRDAGRVPAPCSGMWCDLTRVYGLAAFDVYKQAAANPFSKPGATDRPPAWMNGRSYEDLIKTLPEALRKSLDKSDASDRSNYCFAVQMKLFERGLSPGEVMTILERSPCAEKFRGPALAAEVQRVAAKREVHKATIERNKTIGNEVPGQPHTPYMTLDQMLQRFVFIRQGSLIGDLVSSGVRNYGDALNDFAASSVPIDDKHSMPTLKLWLAKPGRLSIDVRTWAPGKPKFCKAPAKIDGYDDALNVWCGLPGYEPPQDWERVVEPFDEHVDYLLPVAPERDTWLDWIAHAVQYPGILPHTYWVWVTPVHGIGRNALASILTRVFRGYTAVGLDLEQILEQPYNGSIAQKLLTIVDEAYQGSEDGRKYKRAKKLRELVTQEQRLINPKFGHQYYEYNCIRWLMFSNYEDCIPFDNHDRRGNFAANPTVPRNEAEYARLYALLDDPQFIAAVRHRLQIRDVSNFNPGAKSMWNDMKLKALEATTSELDRVVADLAKRWLGSFIANSIVARHVNSEIGSIQQPAAIAHAMRRAGFNATDFTLKIGDRPDPVAMQKKATRISILKPQICDATMLKRSDPRELEHLLWTWWFQFIT